MEEGCEQERQMGERVRKEGRREGGREEGIRKEEGRERYKEMREKRRYMGCEGERVGRDGRR